MTTAIPEPKPSGRPNCTTVYTIFACLLAAQAVFAGANAVPPAGSGQRKALFTGPSDSRREPDGSLGHSQYGRVLFLGLVGNPANAPAKGWTCDMSDDVILRLGHNLTDRKSV